MKILEALKKTILKAAEFNSNIQVGPICILWPDKERQWEKVVPRLQKELPDLFALGVYNPEKKIGPAIWLRCVVDGKIEVAKINKIEAHHVKEVKSEFNTESKKNTKPVILTETIASRVQELPTVDSIPILYLPGYSRQDLRAIESCLELLRPLAELQFRGAILSQNNSKDLTILSFLTSKQGGLQLDVSEDADSKNAMQKAMLQFLDEDTESIKNKRLDNDYFNALLFGGDTIKNLLHWLNLGDIFKNTKESSEWAGFVAVCQSQFSFNPDIEGQIKGVTRLANHEGEWQKIWQRFVDSAHLFKEIPNLIRRCPMPFDLFTDAATACGWPQWNDEQERNLHSEFMSLSKLSLNEARKK